MLMTKMVVVVLAGMVADDDVADDAHDREDDDGDVAYGDPSRDFDYGDAYGDGKVVDEKLYCGGMIITTMMMTIWCMGMDMATVGVLMKKDIVVVVTEMFSGDDENNHDDHDDVDDRNVECDDWYGNSDVVANKDYSGGSFGGVC